MIISKIIYYICGVNSLSVFLKRTLGYCTGLFLVTNLRRNITTVQRNYPIGSVDLNRNHSSDVLV